jgi:hypothetical protein
MVEADAKVGIALSGGGVRAAAFSLGALQALQVRAGLLKGEGRARYLSAVSGGAYVAAAYILASGGPLATPSLNASMLSDEERKRWSTEGTGPDGHPVPDARKESRLSALIVPLLRANLGGRFLEGMAAWRSVGANDPLAPGTPEAEFLRRHARYMSEPTGLLATMGTLAVLICLNIAFTVGFFVWIGASLGILSQYILRSLQYDGKTNEFVFALTWQHMTATAILAIVTYGLLLALTSHSSRRSVLGEIRGEKELALRDTYLYISAAFLLVMFVPFLLPTLWEMLDVGSPAEFNAGQLAQVMVAGIASTATFSATAGALAWSKASALPSFVSRPLSRLANGAKTVVYWALQLLLMALVPALLFGALIAGWILGSTRPLAVLIILLAAGVGIYLYFLLISPLPHLTLFAVYRAKLSRCFDVVRQVSSDGSTLRARQRAITPLMSKLRNDCTVPELLICASANVTDTGATAAGSHAQPIIFSPTTVSMPGVSGAELPTDSLERLLATGSGQGGGSRLFGFDGSVLSCVAATGAALSPAMGKYSRRWSQFLMTILNLRLGVWIPNPASERVHEAIHLVGNDSGNSTSYRRPGIRVFVREMLGRHYLRAPQIYVTDGGHYENLGLVELVRRGCTEIWCIDASGDRPGTSLSLSESLTIISSELGYEVDFSFEELALEEDQSRGSGPTIRSTSTTGIIRARSGHPSMSYECQLHVVKLGMDSKTPDRLREMRLRYPKFPYDSTFNQLYTAERFDLYRDLGYDSAARAVERVLAHPG